MAITQEAMAQMISQSVQIACQAMMEQIHAQGGLGGRGPHGGGGHGRCLGSKDFANTGTFDGAESAFADWAFKFKLAMKAKNMDCHKLLELHEKMKTEVKLEELEALTTGDAQKATEIYDVLGLNVSGEALTIVREVDSLNGIEAWRRLMKRYLAEHAATPAGQADGVANAGEGEECHGAGEHHGAVGVEAAGVRARERRHLG